MRREASVRQIIDTVPRCTLAVILGLVPRIYGAAHSQYWEAAVEIEKNAPRMICILDDQPHQSA
jgi:hypothetical protein